MYRVVKYYENFFSHYGYRLEKKFRFLWWEYWGLIELDGLGVSGQNWAKYYNCEIVEKT